MTSQAPTIMIEPKETAYSIVLEKPRMGLHAEAEELEHATSDKLLEKIDEYLGRPEFDPHGDPIPSARGKIARPEEIPLTACQAGRTARIARIADQDANFLKYVNIHGLIPGTSVKISERDPIGDSVLVEVDGHPALALGASAAEKIMVEAPQKLSRRKA